VHVAGDHPPLALRCIEVEGDQRGSLHVLATDPPDERNGDGDLDELEQQHRPHGERQDLRAQERGLAIHRRIGEVDLHDEALRTHDLGHVDTQDPVLADGPEGGQLRVLLEVRDDLAVHRRLQLGRRTEDPALPGPVAGEQHLSGLGPDDHRRHRLVGQPVVHALPELLPPAGGPREGLGQDGQDEELADPPSGRLGFVEGTSLGDAVADDDGARRQDHECETRDGEEGRQDAARRVGPSLGRGRAGGPGRVADGGGLDACRHSSDRSSRPICWAFTTASSCDRAESLVCSALT
jgi:hypothetical protein